MLPPTDLTNETTPQMETGIALLLGEIRGQMRELIHSTNNASMKLDALSVRVSALEADHQRRQGASNVMGMILKSPALGWAVGAVTTIYLFISGKLHI